MSYTDLFTYRDDAELHRRVYIKKPSAIDSIKSLNYYDGNAQQAIAEAEAFIETLKEYRRDLYERYQEIAAANYKLFLFLERTFNRYDNTKQYIITICKRFDGNNVADEEILRETYPGKERHKALKRFDELKKEYPTIENDMDIAKKHWE
jgi:hypothetical protein